jgi:hypothetical protein
MNFAARSFASYSSHATCICRNCAVTDSNARRFNKDFAKRSIRRSAKNQIAASIEENIINWAFASYTDGCHDATNKK